jgi:hypothetical protein
MARGGHKTPPPHTRSPVVMHSRSDNNITLETTTTSNDNPEIPIEPVTPVPQGADVQEIVHQSLIRTHSRMLYLICLEELHSLEAPTSFVFQLQLEGGSNPLVSQATTRGKLQLPNSLATTRMRLQPPMFSSYNRKVATTACPCPVQPP